MENVKSLIAFAILIVATFLLLREVFCWYFKINKRVSLLSDIKGELIQASKYANSNKEPEALKSDDVQPTPTNTKPEESFLRAY
jgi:hypothetical protein